MATASKLNVTLQLNAAECRMLVEVLHRVGGCPTNSRRELVDDVLGALESIGFENEHLDDAAGHMMFREYNT